jgi:hypothetical protein
MKHIHLFTLITMLAITPTAVLAHDTDRSRSHGHANKHTAGLQHGKHKPNRFERRFERRQDKQSRRIREGRRSGELTRGEAKRLRKQQFHIDRIAERYRRDGKLTRGERRHMAKAQDRAGRSIAKSRSNDRYHYRQADNRLAHRSKSTIIWHFIN